ncbi:hypothetical protein [Mycoplasma simbae]|uniref:hypothetical protein n=1 Tax=Mycoplasma simbae TaxID=36744 RepID=UPI0004950EC0|nr:hypothetical protein [Mycoplasma simbae]
MKKNTKLVLLPLLNAPILIASSCTTKIINNYENLKIEFDFNAKTKKLQIELNKNVADLDLKKVEILLEHQNQYSYQNTDFTVVNTNTIELDLTPFFEQHNQDTIKILGVKFNDNSIKINEKLFKLEKDSTAHEDMALSVNALTFTNIGEHTASVKISINNLDASKITSTYIFVNGSKFGNYYIEQNSLVFNLNNLKPSTEYAIESLYVNDKVVELNNTLQTTFTTLTNNEPPMDNPTPPAQKNDNFLVSSINFTEITTNSALINIEFSSRELANAQQKNFVIRINDNDYQINNYIAGSNNISVRLNNLSPNSLHAIQWLKLNGNNLNIANFSTSFRTLPHTSDNRLRDINITDVTSNSARVHVIFSENIESTSMFKLGYTDSNSIFSTTDVTITSPNSLYFTLNNLSSNTAYKLNAVSLNGKNLNKTVYFPEFRTQNIESIVHPSDLKINSVQVDSTTDNQAIIRIKFNNFIENSSLMFGFADNLNNRLNDSDINVLKTSSTAIITLLNLNQSAKYQLKNIYLDQNSLDIDERDQKIFYTKSSLNTHNAIDYRLMDSFNDFEAQKAILNNEKGLQISNIKKTFLNNEQYLLFEFNSIPKEKNKLFTFEYGALTYKLNYDGNSKVLLSKVSAAQHDNVTNITYNSQNIVANVVINSVLNSNSTTYDQVNSISLDGDQLVLNGSNINDDEYVFTLKPEVNYYNADFTFKSLASNGTIRTNADNLDKGFDTYVLTSVFNITKGKKLNLREGIKLRLNNNLNARVSKVQFAKKANSYNTFIGSINLHIDSNEDVKKLKNKYIKLSFVDKFQKNLPSQADTERNYYHGQGYDWEPKEQRLENNKFVYLNFDELKTFEFNNLTQGIEWELRSIDIVNKHNLQVYKSLDLANTAKLGLNVLYEQIHTNNSGFINAFSNSLNNQTIEGTNITFDEFLNMQQAGELSELPFNDHDIAFTRENYLNLNKFYLYETQKYYWVMQEGEYNNKLQRAKFGTTKFNLGNKNYNFATIVENYAQKEFAESTDKTTFTMRKKLNNFKNLDQSKDAIINFNFFGSPTNINLSYWSHNQNSYAISFSYNELVKNNNVLDNIKIDFVRNWEGLYRDIYFSFNNNRSLSASLSDLELENIMNQMLKAKVWLDYSTNELVIELKTRDINAQINKDIYLHDYSQKPSIFIEKALNYTSIMYIDESNSTRFSYVNEELPKNNYLKISGFLFDKKTDFKPINIEEQIQFDAIEWRTTEPNNPLYNDEAMNSALARGIGSRKGTMWMVAKVDPYNDKDYRFYVATNRHVPVFTNENVHTPLDHISREDNSLTVSKDHEFRVDNQLFWEGVGNKKIDGTSVTGANSNLRSGADIQINIMNIKWFVDFYNANKSNESTLFGEQLRKFKISKHVEKWMHIKHNKVSNKGRYIKNQQFVSLYASSFPYHAGKKNAQVRFNYMPWIKSEGSEFNKGLADEYRVMRIFKDVRAGSTFNLASGSSGTGIFDDEGNIYGIHALGAGLFSGGNILNTQRINFLGELGDYNDASFAYKVEQLHRLYPDKYPLTNIFNQFVKPIDK